MSLYFMFPGEFSAGADIHTSLKSTMNMIITCAASGGDMSMPSTGC